MTAMEGIRPSVVFDMRHCCADKGVLRAILKAPGEGHWYGDALPPLTIRHHRDHEIELLLSRVFYVAAAPALVRADAPPRGQYERNMYGDTVKVFEFETHEWFRH